jgi:hypothetical protein
MITDLKLLQEQFKSYLKFRARCVTRLASRLDSSVLTNHLSGTPVRLVLSNENGVSVFPLMEWWYGIQSQNLLTGAESIFGMELFITISTSIRYL